MEQQRQKTIGELVSTVMNNAFKAVAECQSIMEILSKEIDLREKIIADLKAQIKPEPAVAAPQA
jgi:hypothetical protein